MTLRSAAFALLALLFSANAAAQETGQPAEGVDEALRAEIEADLVAIPAGRFRQGDLSGHGQLDEKPVRSVAIGAFRLSKVEVTFDLYDRYARATGRSLPKDQGMGRGRRPVVNVSWRDAEGFLDWLNARTGGHYRLPSESEWEYAARAGTTTDYPWGDRFDAALANGYGKGGADDFEYTAPVGSFPPNAWGLHDMIGNVWEWVQDFYVEGYGGAPVDGSARTSDFNLTQRVYRGGSWANDSANLRVSDRSWQSLDARYYYLGFRIARDE